MPVRKAASGWSRNTDKFVRSETAAGRHHFFSAAVQFCTSVSGGVLFVSTGALIRKRLPSDATSYWFIAVLDIDWTEKTRHAGDESAFGDRDVNRHQLARDVEDLPPVGNPMRRVPPSIEICRFPAFPSTGMT